MSIDSATKILKDVKEMTIVNTSGSGHELTQDMDDIKNVRSSDAEIDKATDEVTIASVILKRNTIYGTKANVKLRRSVHRAVISKTHTINKIMNILSLGEVVAGSCGCDLNLKKVTKKGQVEHMKLLTKTTHNKDNILRTIPYDEHIIYVKKNKGTSVGGSVNKKSRIVLSGSKTNSGNNRGEVLKPSTRNLLEAIKRMTKKADMTIWNRVAKSWVHVDLLMQLTMKKGILHKKSRIKLEQSQEGDDAYA
jgi:hypothetical protein